ncbi:MAG: aspartate carbamoyltransferase [Kiritimatiellia bacterium]|jgi:aspartate carbamoyltransferase catalytic subunit|nr:aspartate carbamoyltransferase [Kiritimatiellia bacterium]MDP6630543.1 aspartate carbamoyltransferase [Kiritimatiellia bacterium]MDP6811217.1 aspartate carbamoyltransferase [Kiritimatiellia bacterium]MDP7024338.1 aspartate carbamoyltransferase [Kiritimatiellia bacterium]
MALTDIAWEAFYELDPVAKSRHLNQDDGRPFHTLMTQQFDRAALDTLGELATRVRFLAKTKEGMAFLSDLLPHRRAMLYFTQPSTRTFLSFCSACEILGMRIGTVRNTATSSELKGETKDDSVRTFSSYFDCVIMRTQVGGLAERMAWVLSNSERPVPIINAGSGKDQHPTQALLDVYTLQRSFEARGGIDGKTVVFVGDLLRGRTVRSLSALLTNYEGVRQVFIAPPQLQVADDVLAILDAHSVDYRLGDTLESVVPEADAIYMTRVQDEWDAEAGESAKIDIERFWFREAYLSQLKSDAVIMHPLPRRHEIPAAIDNDPRAMYWRQMRNGMWIRAALIATIFGCDGEINAFDEA